VGTQEIAVPPNLIVDLGMSCGDIDKARTLKAAEKNDFDRRGDRRRLKEEREPYQSRRTHQLQAMALHGPAV
jgi:hypothetical protein